MVILERRQLLQVRLNINRYVVSSFQQGVVIVDSPGIGESDIMDDIVVNYLPNAFAFIYVINSSLEGGVQKDRVSASSDARQPEEQFSF